MAKKGDRNGSPRLSADKPGTGDRKAARPGASDLVDDLAGRTRDPADGDATDAVSLTPAGIPTYGISGLFRDPDGNGVHGLNERIRVSSLRTGARSSTSS